MSILTHNYNTQDIYFIWCDWFEIGWIFKITETIYEDNRHPKGRKARYKVKFYDPKGHPIKDSQIFIGAQTMGIGGQWLTISELHVLSGFNDPILKKYMVMNLK